MKLLIDGEQMKSSIEDEKSLENALGTIKDITGCTNRIIKSIEVDGVVLSAQTEKQLLKKKMSAIKKLQVETDTPLKLAINILVSADDYLLKSEVQINKFVAALQSGGAADEYDSFSENLKGWATVMQLLGIVRDDMQLDLNNIKVKGHAVPQIVADLEKTLVQVKKALQTKDMVFLQDLLRYELITNAGKLRLVLKAVLECARKKLQAG
jgi:hypothetical protein